MERRQQIQRFLVDIQPVRLSGLIDGPYTKAGVVPFIRQAGGFSYYAMKPRAKRPDLPPPEFQLCKGTRMTQEDGQWRDMRDGEVSTELSETLLEAALREGMEEIGLVLGNILSLYDVGGHSFASAANGRSKAMWLFAAKMREGTNFTGTESSTAERAWLTLEEFGRFGRSDHYDILSIIDSLLKKAVHAPG